LDDKVKRMYLMGRVVHIEVKINVHRKLEGKNPLGIPKHKWKVND
jgi:hypothetical protein